MKIKNILLFSIMILLVLAPVVSAQDKLQMWRNASTQTNVSWVDNNGNWFMLGNLNVSGTLNGNTSAWSKSGTNIFPTTLTDYVGIGTSSPDSQFQLHGSTGFRLTDSNQNANEYAEVKYDNAGVTNLYINNDYTNSNALINFQLAADTKMVVRGDGNVGIGTTSPAYLLDINKTSDNAYLRIGSGTASKEQAILFADNIGNKWALGDSITDDFYIHDYTRGARVFQIEDNGNMALMQNGGNVGVGTSSPSSLLHLNGTTAQFRLQTAGTNDPNMVFYNSSSEYKGGVWYDISEDHLELNAGTGSGASNQLVIQPDGNVGIGTDSPSGSLDVVKSNGNNIIYLDTYDDTDSSRTYLRFRKSGSDTMGGLTPTVDGETFGQIDFYGVSSDSSQFAYGASIKGVQNGAVGTVRAPTDLTFLTSPGGTTTPTERMRIDKDGNVGIGTTSPTRLLDINDSSASMALTSATNGQSSLWFADTDTNIGGLLYTHTNNQMEFRVNDASRMAIDSSGQVGIGTTSPSTALEVNGTILTGYGSPTTPSLAWSSDPTTGIYGAAGEIRTSISGTLKTRLDGAQLYSNTANSWSLDLSASSTTNPAFAFNGDEDTGLGRSGTNQLAFITAGTEKMTVQSGGNVGIGTTGPGTKLDVRDNISTTYSTTGYAATISNSMLYLNNENGGSNTASLINFRTGTGDGLVGFVEGGGTNDADFIIATDGGSNGIERFRILNNGNIGIGTTSPVAKLNLNGSGTLAGNGIGWGEDGNTGIHEESADQLRITIAATEEIVIDNDEIKGTVNGNPAIFHSRTTSDSYPVYTFVGNTNTGIAQPVSNQMSFISNTNEIMRVSTTSIGINTSSPQNTLNVVGDINATGEIYRNEKKLIDWSQASNGTLYTSTNPFGFYNSTTLPPGGSETDPYWTGNQSSYSTSAVIAANYYALNNPFNYYNSTNPQTETDPLWSANYSAHNSTWTTTDSEIWAVASNDTFVPYTGSNANVVLGNYNFSVGTSDLFVNANTNNVGIGTTSPSVRLEIKDTARPVMKLISTATSADPGPIIYLNRESTSPADGDGIGAIYFDALPDAGPATTFARIRGVMDNVTDGSEDGSIRFDTTVAGDTSHEAMRIVGGNVGIGTTSPSTNLEVVNNTLGAGIISTIQDTLIINSGPQTYVYDDRWGNGAGVGLLFKQQHYTGGESLDSARISTVQTDQIVDAGKPALTFQTGDAGSLSESMRITYDGNVGIGTDSPSDLLNVNGNLNVTGVGEFTGGYINIWDGGTLTGYVGDAVNLAFAGLTNEDLVLRGIGGIGFTTNDGASDAMYINSSGNVGIGTTAPDQMLHLQSLSTSIIHLENTGSAQAILELDGDRSGVDENIGFVKGQWNGNDVAEVNFKSGQDTTNKDEGWISFGTSPAGGGGVLSRMVIREDGNVGIGTSSPSTILELATNNPVLTLNDTDGQKFDIANVNSDFTIRNSSASRVFNILQSGNVGIGTASPDGELHVSGTTPLLMMGSSTAGNDIDIQFDEGDSDVVQAGIHYEADTNSIHLQTGNLANTNALVVDSAGFVGIGTASPSTMFSVAEHMTFNDSNRLLEITNTGNLGGINLEGSNARIYFGGIRAIEGSSVSSGNLNLGEGYSSGKVQVVGGADFVVDTDTMYVDAGTNNVGIGTIDPNYTLEVVGSADFASGTTGAVTTYWSSIKPADYRHFKIGGIKAEYTTSSWDSGEFNLLGPDLDGWGTPLTYVTLKSEGADKVVYVNANMGIGTATPTSKLHVVGNASVSTNFSVDTNTLFVDSSTNRVGIGTSSPTSPLYINASTHSGAAIVVDRLTGGGVASIQAGPSNPWLMLEGQSTTGNVGVNFYSSGDVILANGGGNVGIGTTTPSHNLQVSGAGGSTPLFAVTGTDAEAVRMKINNTEGQFEIRTDGGALTIDDDTDNAIRMVIDTAGNVGIGTGTPSSQLHISDSTTDDSQNTAMGRFQYENEGSVIINRDSANNFYLGTSSTNELMHFGSEGTKVITIDATQEVGINTIAPETIFTIDQAADDNGIRIYGFDDVSTRYGELFIDASGYTNLDAGGDRGLELKGHAIDFYVNSGNDFFSRMTYDGKFGINTTNPQQELNVAGDANVTGTMYIGDSQVFTDGSGNMVFRI